MWFYKLNQIFLERLQHDSDLLLAIENVFKQHDMRMGYFAVIGAVKRAHIAFYDQEKKQYTDTTIDKPTEILSCIGNVTEIEGKISFHAHIRLGTKTPWQEAAISSKAPSSLPLNFLASRLKGNSYKGHSMRLQV
jgi:predicted DNA-binding protein with PD1-like motif